MKNSLVVVISIVCAFFAGTGYAQEPGEVAQKVVDALHKQGVASDEYSAFSSRSSLGTVFTTIQTPGRSHWGELPHVVSPPIWCGPEMDSTRCVDAGNGKRLRTCQAASEDCPICEPGAYLGSRPGVKVCAGHSDDLLDQVYQAVSSAQHHVDIAYLEEPEGRFDTAIRHALKALDRGGRPVSVSFLFGVVPGIVDQPSFQRKAQAWLDATRAGLSAGSKLRVTAAFYRYGAMASWTHVKILAVDGERAMVGGHNLNDTAYLGPAPAHDLSVDVVGPPALQAHRFLNFMWARLCEETKHHPTLFHGVAFWRGSSAPDPQQDLPAHCRTENRRLPAQATVLPDGWSQELERGRDSVLGVGRLGARPVDRKTPPASDVAHLAMLRSAQKTIRMSIQDLGPYQWLEGTARFNPWGFDWPTELLAVLADRLRQGVHVFITLSSFDGKAGLARMSKYEYSYTMQENVKRIDEQLVKAGVGQRERETLLCRQLHLGPMRFSEEQWWPQSSQVDRLLTIANHAKTFVVDDRAFYVGSQNLYLSDNAEFGYIVDSRAATERLLSDYFRPLWEQAKWWVTPTCTAGHLSMSSDAGQWLVEFDGSRMATGPGQALLLDSDASFLGGGDRLPRLALGTLDSTTGTYTVLATSKRGAEMPPPTQLSIPRDGTLRPFERPDLCLDAGSNGDRLSFARCAPGLDRQQWRHAPDRTIASARWADRCVDVVVRADGPTEQAVGLFGCHGRANQRWSVREVQGPRRVLLKTYDSGGMFAVGRYGERGAKRLELGRHVERQQGNRWVILPSMDWLAFPPQERGEMENCVRPRGDKNLVAEACQPGSNTPFLQDFDGRIRGQQPSLCLDGSWTKQVFTAHMDLCSSTRPWIVTPY